MSNSVLCLVPEPSRAKRVADDLRAAGFQREDISLVIPDRVGARDFTFDWLIGAGALALPGMGPFLAAGPLFILLDGATNVGTDGVSRALESLGMSEFDAKQLESQLKAGSSLVAVLVDGKVETTSAQEICARHGAEQVCIVEESSAEPAQ